MLFGISMMHVEEMCSQNKTGQYVDAKQYLSSGSAKAQVTVQPYRNSLLPRRQAF